MKNLVLIIIFAFVQVVTFTQITSIPDPNFEAHLVAEGFDSDGIINGQILTSDAQNIDTIIIGSNGTINSFTGLEAFSNLKYFSSGGFAGNTINLQGTVSLDFLKVSVTNASSIIFEQNQQLTQLYLWDMDINYLDLTNCPQLEVVDTWSCPLDSINLTGNPLLKKLEVTGGHLTSLNIENNSKLTLLNVAHNEITAIDMHHLDSLVSLGIGNNQITELDVSNNPELFWLSCDTNQIQKLDVSQNPSLQYLYCSANQLAELNVQNGNNGLISSFGFTALGNPNLTCIQVDTVGYSNTTWTSIDPQSYFSTYCGYDLGFDEVKPQSLVLFPNPASNHFTIQTPNIMKDGIVQIVNARGQLVYEKSILNQSEINLDLELSAGCYIIKVNTLTDTYNERLIIR